jgi:thymidylate synthase ThyX
MKVLIRRIVGWDFVIDSARTTVGKNPINKYPSEEFKKSILISEHSPIRKLLYDIIWEEIPYWVAMHIRTHHLGFKSSDDDLYFVETQRTDRRQLNRNELKQDSKVILNAQLNAQSIINVSRVRLCKKASKETTDAWVSMLEELKKIEPLLYSVCIPNCIYKNGLCPENKNCCGYNKTQHFKDCLKNYKKLF